MTQLSMTAKARSSRRFALWWASESPARAYGGQVLNIVSCYVQGGGQDATTWESDLCVLHVAWQQYRVLSICADRRCPPVRLKYSMPSVSQDIGFARDELLRWMVEFREMITATATALPPIPGVDERVCEYWNEVRAIAEVAGGRWPGTVERLILRFGRAVLDLRPSRHSA
ncbi:DUF3631 domain-containing protein [Paraburkholderia nemoris]|uniref:DUF3631 domain-containing protein n=1 Tax=Paraburkholderia nemoris TaxID=2793076 RepID=UPI0038BB2C0D